MYCYLEHVPRELLGAELAVGAALRTRVPEVVLHEHARDHGPAVRAARHRVVLARVQVRLQLAQLVRPLAPLLVVDAVHHGAHDGLLRLGVRVDLGTETLTC